MRTSGSAHTHNVVELGYDQKPSLQYTKGSVPKSDTESFVWLSKWIMYFPTVTTTKYDAEIRSSKPRNTVCNWSFVVISVIVTVGECLWYSITPFYDYWKDDWLYPMVYAAATILTTAAKLISIYYFWRCFDFSSLCTLRLNAADSTYSLKQDLCGIVKKANLRMKVILAMLCTCILTLVCIKLTKLFMEVEYEGILGWFGVLRSVLYYWMFDIPLFLAQFVLSIYYLKGCIFVSSLIERVDQNDELSSICEDYRTFRDVFKSQIDVLELIVKCRMIALVPWIWIDLTYVMESKSALDGIEECIYLAMSALPIIELVLAGSAATTQYYALKTTVFKIKDFSVQVVYLLVVIVEYPFLVKIFAKEVSLTNALKITAAFIVAKAISYLFSRTA
eukprot:CAMPEP_0197028926 /NCGR_PEP_ID=MMETSP1384-20130603/8502_1 /TAXON_ID=29189 /ORGANISM="Ammonia sp." /LENGTH=390 /DNA_ID=CAMNT_0042458007 /DNA_START=34 /DNA_END=1206 /DNA_ORIENTATION=+